MHITFVVNETNISSGTIHDIATRSLKNLYPSNAAAFIKTRI